jgi:tetratricopeptide (TPR) repeat protein
MLQKLQPKGKIALIVSLIIVFGLLFRVGLDKFFYEEPNGAITPPIDAKDEADRFIQIASQNFFYHEFDKAVENYKKAIALFEERKNFKRAARTYESIGDIYKFAHKSKATKNAYLSALEYHQKLQDKIGEGRAMKKIGEFYMELSDFDKAGEWFGKAVMQVRDAKPHIAKAKIYEIQGHYFLKTEQFSRALEAFLQAKATFDKAGYPLGYDNISPMIHRLKRQQKDNAT